MGSVEYSIPILSINGRLGKSQIVFYRAQGKALARVHTDPSNPKSANQTTVRSFMALTAQGWGALTDEQREAWTAYASLYFAPKTGGAPPTGAQLFNKIAFFRLAMSQPLPGMPPAGGPPAPLTDFQEMPAANARSFIYSVAHYVQGAGQPGGEFKLMARITPPVTAGQTPNQNALRYIAGVGPDSFVTLPANGMTAEFTNARFAIPRDAKYRVELTVISPDGVPSLPLARNLKAQRTV